MSKTSKCIFFASIFLCFVNFFHFILLIHTDFFPSECYNYIFYILYGLSFITSITENLFMFFSEIKNFNDKVKTADICLFFSILVNQILSIVILLTQPGHFCNNLTSIFYWFILSKFSCFVLVILFIILFYPKKREVVNYPHTPFEYNYITADNILREIMDKENKCKEVSYNIKEITYKIIYL